MKEAALQSMTRQRDYETLETHALKIALFHTMGGLPEPEFTHRFC